MQKGFCSAKTGSDLLSRTGQVIGTFHKNRAQIKSRRGEAGLSKRDVSGSLSYVIFVFSSQLIKCFMSRDGEKVKVYKEKLTKPNKEK